MNYKVEICPGELLLEALNSSLGHVLCFTVIHSYYLNSILKISEATQNWMSSYILVRISNWYSKTHMSNVLSSSNIEKNKNAITDRDG